MKGKLVIIDGKQYDEYEIDTGKQIATIREYVPTEEEIQAKELEEQNQLRIAQLKEIISNKKLLDMDFTAEQNELKELLGL